MKTTVILVLICALSVSAAPWWKKRPSANFRYSPQTGQAPLTVSFTDSSSGAPTSWLWTFGDYSANSTLQSPTHTFAGAGSYTVTLQVSNNFGESVASNRITVTNAPVPPPPPPPISFTNLTLVWTDAATGFLVYTAYQGTASGAYTRWIATTNQTATFSNMVVGVSDFFSVTATATNGLTSVRSQELVVTP